MCTSAEVARAFRRCKPVIRATAAQFAESNEDTEKWCWILGWEHFYEVSNHARVRSVARHCNCYGGGKRFVKEIILKQTFCRGTGYNYVNLFRDNINNKLLVHRAVALAFVPNPEGKPQVNHKDGNKLNNLPSNLEWVTIAENAHHASVNGLLPIQSKLTKEEVLIILDRIKAGDMQKDIAKDFGVVKSVITYVKQGKYRGR